MNPFSRIGALWRSFWRRRRFNMLDETGETEEWHINLSAASILAAALSFLLLLFIIVLSLVAYTPVLEFLPGYRTEADRSRENLVQSIIRIDSMERIMNDMRTYNDNIALIMEGRTPVARTLGSATDTARANKVLVMPSAEDSLLRAQMEGDGPYSITGHGSRRQIREAMELTTPADGIIVDRFDIKEGRYGVGIAATAGDRIMAVREGTAVLSVWTPEDGYTVILQHDGELLSVYRNLSRSLVVKGQSVRAGEPIGYNTEAGPGGENPLFAFELWNHGKPVDPETYIVF